MRPARILRKLALGATRAARSLSGNARVFFYTEFMWSLPVAWYGYYFPMYVRQLGISEDGWGLLLSIGSLVHLLFSPVGGFLADRFGRKRTLILVCSVT